MPTAARRRGVAAEESPLAGQGEVAQLAREVDWSRTPLGAVSGWPPALVTMLRHALESPLPMCVLWARTTCSCTTIRTGC